MLPAGDGIITAVCNYRVTTHLDNLEKSGNSSGKGKVRGN